MNEHQEELITERESLEALTVDQLVDHVLTCGEKATALERSMNTASEVLEGYGTSIETELQKRERETENGTK